MTLAPGAPGVSQSVPGAGEGRSVRDIMTQRERVLCVSLTDAEWQAFVERHPQPVDWLRQQILEQIPREVHGPVLHASDAPTRQPNPSRV